MKNLHQVHFWVSEDDYEFLVRQAAESNETVSTLLRRLLRHHRAHSDRAASGKTVGTSRETGGPHETQ